MCLSRRFFSGIIQCVCVCVCTCLCVYVCVRERVSVSVCVRVEHTLDPGGPGRPGLPWGPGAPCKSKRKTHNQTMMKRMINLRIGRFAEAMG